MLAVSRGVAILLIALTGVLLAGTAPTAAAESVDLVGTQDGRGYYTLERDGTIRAGGSARGDWIPDPNSWIPDPNEWFPVDAEASAGRGLWVLGSDGSVAALGSATAVPVPDDWVPDPNDWFPVDLEATADGRGLWMLGSDGRVRSAGSATAVPDPNSWIPDPNEWFPVDLEATADGRGLWMLGSDGRVLTAGRAHSYGSLINPDRPAVGLEVTPNARGYRTLDAFGAVQGFGSAFVGKR